MHILSFFFDITTVECDILSNVWIAKNRSWKRFISIFLPDEYENKKWNGWGELFSCKQEKAFSKFQHPNETEAIEMDEE